MMFAPEFASTRGVQYLSLWIDIRTKREYREQFRKTVTRSMATSL